MQSVEIYRVTATNRFGRVCKRWDYKSTKAFEAQKERRDSYRSTYTIVCEKLDFATGTWQTVTE